MPQMSKYPLDKETKVLLFSKFRQSIASLRDSNTVASFLSDFLSDTEELMLAKRFAIAVLLYRGRRAKDIKYVLHVSNSATGAVAAWLKNAKPETITTLERIIVQNNWEQFIDKIDAMFDSLPPRYGTDWSRIGKEKWVHRKVRSARAKL